MTNLHDLLIAGRMLGGSGGTPAPEPVLIEKTITANGTYTAEDDSADGYSSVTVNVTPPAVSTYAEGIKYSAAETALMKIENGGFDTSSGITLEMCFIMHNDERATARFFSTYNNIVAVALDTYDGVRNMELAVAASWVIAYNSANTFAIPIGVLSTITVVITPSSWSCYLNGALMADGTNNQISFDTLFVGSAGGSDRNLIDTDMYNVRVYERALSAAEIAANRAVDVEKYGS